jgi:phosphatidylethanolamine/phosphatidyl-N-methylethanolamine N-methyltransferase
MNSVSMSVVLETLQFLGQCATHMRTTGAVAPSGKRLARAMVNAVGLLEPGQVIVELGPGTGVFTRELRKRFPMHPIVAVEFNEAFVKKLRERMNDVQVVHGCASQLVSHLAASGYADVPVGAIVSGLPLLSLPRDLGNAIFAAIAEVLPPGRRYVQFTYSKRMWKKFSPPGFRFDQSRMVWLNVPPAVVMPFTRV